MSLRPRMLPRGWKSSPSRSRGQRPAEMRGKNYGEKLGLVPDLSNRNYAGGKQGCGEHWQASMTGRMCTTHGSGNPPSGRLEAPSP